MINLGYVVVVQRAAGRQYLVYDNKVTPCAREAIFTDITDVARLYTSVKKTGGENSSVAIEMVVLSDPLSDDKVRDLLRQALIREKNLSPADIALLTTGDVKYR